MLFDSVMLKQPELVDTPAGFSSEAAVSREGGPFWSLRSQGQRTFTSLNPGMVVIALLNFI